MNWPVIGILAYLALQMAIGFRVSRRVHNETDYVLAGRSLGVGLASFSIFATWFGAESIQGAAGSMYSDGLSGGSADPFGYVLCILLVGAIFARPLWNRGFTTFGDLFRARYSSGVERFVILLIVPTSVFWAASQVRAFGNVVSHVSGVPLELAITAAALFVVLYTSVGGLLADAWTDLVQGIAVIIGLVVLLGVLLVNGDLQAAWRQVPTGRLAVLGDGQVPWFAVLEAWAVPVVGSMLAVELLSRVLGCRSAETARRACFVGGGLYLAVGAIPAVLGLCGPWLVPGLEDGEQLVPVLASQHLAAWVYVPFAGALISAILSTVDSCMLAGSTLVTHNVLLPTLAVALRAREAARLAAGSADHGRVRLAAGAAHREHQGTGRNRFGLRQRRCLRGCLFRAVHRHRRTTQRVGGAVHGIPRVGGGLGPRVAHAVPRRPGGVVAGVPADGALQPGSPGSHDSPGNPDRPGNLTPLTSAGTRHTHDRARPAAASQPPNASGGLRKHGLRHVAERAVAGDQRHRRQARRCQQVCIDPTEATSSQPVSLEQVMHFLLGGERRLWQMPKMAQHHLALAEGAARNLANHERVHQHHAVVEQGRQLSVAVTQVVDPHRRVHEGHGFGRRRDRSATAAEGSDPASRRNREECSRAMRARKPSCTSAVFSVTPVSRRASSNNVSSRIMVVLMHMSMVHVVPLVECNEARARRRSLPRDKARTTPIDWWPRVGVSAGRRSARWQELPPEVG